MGEKDHSDKTLAGAGTLTYVPLASIPAGDYLVELTAKTESGTSQELVAFKVGQ